MEPTHPCGHISSLGAGISKSKRAGSRKLDVHMQGRPGWSCRTSTAGSVLLLIRALLALAFVRPV